MSNVKCHDSEGNNAANNPYLFGYESVIGDKANNREKYARNKEKDEKLRVKKGGILAPIEVNELYDSDKDFVVP